MPQSWKWHNSPYTAFEPFAEEYLVPLVNHAKLEDPLTLIPSSFHSFFQTCKKIPDV